MSPVHLCNNLGEKFLRSKDISRTQRCVTINQFQDFSYLMKHTYFGVNALPIEIKSKNAFNFRNILQIYIFADRNAVLLMSLDILGYIIIYMNAAVFSCFFPKCKYNNITLS